MRWTQFPVMRTRRSQRDAWNPPPSSSAAEAEHRVFLPACLAKVATLESSRRRARWTSRSTSSRYPRRAVDASEHGLSLEADGLAPLRDPPLATPLDRGSSSPPRPRGSSADARRHSPPDPTSPGRGHVKELAVQRTAQDRVLGPPPFRTLRIEDRTAAATTATGGLAGRNVAHRGPVAGLVAALQRVVVRRVAVAREVSEIL